MSRRIKLLTKSEKPILSYQLVRRYEPHYNQKFRRYTRTSVYNVKHNLKKVGDHYKSVKRLINSSQVS